MHCFNSGGFNRMSETLKQELKNIGYFQKIVLMNKFNFYFYYVVFLVIYFYTVLTVVQQFDI